jgi:hypothetical protein
MWACKKCFHVHGAFEGFGVVYVGDISSEYISYSINPIFNANNGKPLWQFDITTDYMLYYYYYITFNGVMLS